MKKISMLVAVVAISLASCKKDRVCTCTSTSSAGGAASVSTVTYTKASKKDARRACMSYTTTSSTGTVTTNDCKLN